MIHLMFLKDSRERDSRKCLHRTVSAFEDAKGQCDKPLKRELAMRPQGYIAVLLIVAKGLQLPVSRSLALTACPLSWLESKLLT